MLQSVAPGETAGLALVGAESHATNEEGQSPSTDGTTMREFQWLPEEELGKVPSRGEKQLSSALSTIRARGIQTQGPSERVKNGSLLVRSAHRLTYCLQTVCLTGFCAGDGGRLRGTDEYQVYNRSDVGK